jgi:hypothetical protein
MKLVVAVIAATAAVVGCRQDNPCGEGRKQTEPAGVFAEIGLPKGAVHCEEADVEPRLFLLGMTEAEAAYAMREQLSKQGWQPVDLPAAQRESIERDLSNGGSPRNLQMFSKQGTSRRARVVVQQAADAKLAVVSLDDVECPDPKTTPDERSPDQRSLCP